MAADSPSEEGVSALSQRAQDILAESGNCAQTSFAVLQEAFDLPGIALCGETCGAVVGGMVALGLVYGRDDLGDWNGYIASLPAARRFCRRFESANGGTACADILEARLGRRFNLANPVKAAEYGAAGVPQACGEVIGAAVQVAAELISRKA